MKIQFNHRLYYEYYYYNNCAVEISKDGITWIPIWDYEPYETRENHTITLYTTYFNTTNYTYISWTFYGNTSEIYAWYLDDIEISSFTALENPEYTNTIIIPELQLNTSKYVDFTNWNPQFPPNQPNCQKLYLVTSWTTLISPPDDNPSNDQQTKAIILQYLHDVRISEFLSPSYNHKNTPPQHKNLSNTTPPPQTYIAPGTYPLQIRVENQGTYPEDNLTCYTEIWEYDNYNSTIVFNSSISNITLPPLEGEQTLNFGNFTFENETIYFFIAKIPLANDYYPKNNIDGLGIIVDNTPPVTKHHLHPEKPNGENGWYTEDVDLELIANDNDDYYGSGVDYIQYRINKSNWITTYNGATITISQDSPELLIEYRAVDMVGNMEEPNNFTIKLDHTVPKPVDACWQSDRQGLNWYIIFTINGEDNISGMSHCEMYINNGFYETQTGPGPWYTFTLQWSSIFKKLKFNFKAYNQAGLYAEDYLDSITALTSSHSNPLIFSKLFYSHPTNH